MSALPIQPGVELPALPDGHRIRRLVRARMPEAQAVHAAEVTAPHAHWSASVFGLHNVELYASAPEATRRAVLESVGRGLLEEAYFIEKLGISFAAKMVLLGESVDERMLYGCFAAEEARHFDGIRGFLQGAVPDRPGSVFLTLLNDVIANGDRSTLQFVIQVVLEGWGLQHYRSLRDGCSSDPLRTLLDSILQDEAGHHGSGRVLFSASDASPHSLASMEEVLAAMLQLVRLGPQGALGALDNTLGGLSRTQRVQVLKELSGPETAQEKLEHLRQLMRLEGARSMLDRLESRGLFVALSPEECV